MMGLPWNCPVSKNYRHYHSLQYSFIRIMMGLPWYCPVFVVVIITVTMGLVAFAWLVLLGFVLFDGGGSMLVCVIHYLFYDDVFTRSC